MTIRRVGWFSASIGILLVFWIALLAAVMRFSDAAPAALVMFPDADLIAALPKEASITDFSPLSITVSVPGSAVAARLYEAGARLVLPAGLQGCYYVQNEMRYKNL